MIDTNCNIEIGNYSYTVNFEGILNMKAENEQDVLNKLTGILNKNGIVLKKTPYIKNVITKRK